MSLIGSLFPLFSWLLYGALVGLIERKRFSLSSMMSKQRRRWVANAVHRETPIDAILTSNLMGSISFFASTSVLMMLALFAIFGELDYVVQAVNRITLAGTVSISAFVFHIMAMIMIFILTFLSFTLSLRQFNHFCILLGAADHSEATNENEVTAIAALNTMAARNFNQGIRGYYFAIAALGWFWHPLIGIATTLIMVIVLIYREFYSISRDVVAQLLEHNQNSNGSV